MPSAPTLFITCRRPCYFESLSTSLCQWVSSLPPPRVIRTLSMGMGTHALYALISVNSQDKTDASRTSS
jgi:hypothetical protein